MARPALLASDLQQPARHAAGGGFTPSLQAVRWDAMDRSDTIQAWDALARNAAEPNPFLESWYLLPALQALDPAGKVRILRFEIGGDLAGLLPVLRSDRYYRWPIPHWQGWQHPNCFLGAPLVARGTERAFWQALLDWADRNAGAGLFLHLAEFPLGGVLHDALRAVLAEQGRSAALVARHDRALLAGALGPEAYFDAAVPGKKRKELRRQFARLAELGTIEVERREGLIGLTPWLDEFLLLEDSGWKGAAGSALARSATTDRMFREALSGAAQRGRLERLALRLDGRPIAMLATFLTPPGSFSFKTAFDEAFARYSPGVLLQRENLALLERPGIDWCDSCAAADHPMIERLWRDRRAIGRLSIAIGGGLRRTAFAALARAELGRNPTGIEP